MSSTEKHDSEKRVRDFSRLPQGPGHKKAKIIHIHPFIPFLSVRLEGQWVPRPTLVGRDGSSWPCASTASQAMWFGATDPLLGCVFCF